MLCCLFKDFVESFFCCYRLPLQVSESNFLFLFLSYSWITSLLLDKGREEIIEKRQDRMQDQRQESKDRRQNDIAGPPLMCVCLLRHVFWRCSEDGSSKPSLNVRPLLLATPGSTVQFGELEVFDMP